MSIDYRRATSADNFTTFTIFQKSLMDFSRRMGVTITGGNDPEKMDALWESRRPFWEHLTNTSDNFWIAEQDGEAIGYARSIVRGDHRELTEFFVLPGNQSAGVGWELIRRAFPHDTPHRSIIATPDLRAQARYLKAGVYTYMTELYFERTPEPVPYQTDLVIETSDAAQAPIEAMNMIDLEILGHWREVDHHYLINDRKLHVYKRDGSVIGYGYLQRDLYGPFALLDENDFPAVLAHAETWSYDAGASAVGFETPTVNKFAIKYLLKLPVEARIPPRRLYGLDHVERAVRQVRELPAHQPALFFVNRLLKPPSRAKHPVDGGVFSGRYVSLSSSKYPRAVS